MNPAPVVSVEDQVREALELIRPAIQMDGGDIRLESVLGGIVTVSPGKGGMGTFAPRLDTAGNSVKGQLAAAFLSHQLGLDLFISEPERKS